MNIDITEVRKEHDVKCVEKIAYISWNESYAGIISQEQIDFMLNTIQSAKAINDDISRGYRYYIISADKGHCGYVAVRSEIDRLFLSKIYVLKKCQRKGIACHVIGFLRQMCSETGERSIYLTVNRNNEGAIAFYKKAGFVIVGDKLTEIGNGFVMDDHVMELLVR